MCLLDFKRFSFMIIHVKKTQEKNIVAFCKGRSPYRSLPMLVGWWGQYEWKRAWEGGMEQVFTEMEESLPNLQDYSWAKAGPFDLEAIWASLRKSLNNFQKESVIKKQLLKQNP